MILISGVAGFIGFNLAKYLLEQGEDVIGIDFLEDLVYGNNIKLDRLKELGIDRIEINKSTQSQKYPNFYFAYVEITDEKRLNELFIEYRFKTVVHLASVTGIRIGEISPDKFVDINIKGFFNIINLSKKYAIDKFIYTSSSSVYGLKSLNITEPIQESFNSDTPMSLYAATKKTNELIAHVYSYVYNLKTIGFRIYKAYGPWDKPTSFIYTLTKNIINNKPITIYNNGEISKDLVYIDDVVKCIYLTIKDNTIGLYKIFNLGSSETVKTMDLVNEIELYLNKTATKQFAGKPLSTIPYTCADTSELYNFLNFKPSITYKEGIKKFVDWYFKYNLKKM